MIRPLQFGDIFLIQRLGRQATKLNTIQSLIQPQSTFWASLSTLLPWNNAKLTTYVLRQNDHGLTGAGLLLAQKRPGRPEVDIIALSPALDTADGHPSIWEKLLAAYSQEVTQQQISRIYVDVPDQPLPVSTFSHVGFKLYTRQTVWRLPAQDVAPGMETLTGEIDAGIRLRASGDEWGLLRLYARTIPAAVQVAEGMQTEKGLKPPILDGFLQGASRHYVLTERGEITGALQILRGQRGYWLQVWADMLRPDGTIPQRLVRFGLEVVRRTPGLRLPVYVGVNDYHGGLGSILAEAGFVPFTDRARMVRQVVQWVREFAPAAAALESVPAGVVTPFMAAPQPRSARAHINGEFPLAALSAAGQDHSASLLSSFLPSSRSHLLFRLPSRLLSGLAFRWVLRGNQRTKEAEQTYGNYRMGETVKAETVTAETVRSEVATESIVTEHPCSGVSCEHEVRERAVTGSGLGDNFMRAMARTQEAGRRRARPAARPRRENRTAAVGA